MYSPSSWARAMTDFYTRVALALDPDQYGKACILRESWRERRGMLDWADERALRRLRFYRRLHQDGRTGEYEV